jgi:hypothetical protein
MDIIKTIEDYRNNYQNLDLKQVEGKYFTLGDKIEGYYKDGNYKNLKATAEESLKYIEIVIISDKYMNEYCDLQMKYLGKYTETKANSLAWKDVLEICGSNANTDNGRKFNIDSMSCIDTYSYVSSRLGKKEDLDVLLNVVNYFVDLNKWKDGLINSYANIDLYTDIMNCLSKNPGITKKEIQLRLKNYDARNITNIIKLLGVFKELRIDKDEKNWYLFRK